MKFLATFLLLLTPILALAAPKNEDYTVTHTRCISTTTKYVATVTVTGKPPKYTHPAHVTTTSKKPHYISTSYSSTSTTTVVYTVPAPSNSTSTVLPTARTSTTPTVSAPPVQQTNAANGLKVAGNMGAAAAVVAGLLAMF